MQTIKLSKRQLDNLEKYNVPKEVTNTEGVIYYLNIGIKKIDNQHLLFKKLYVNHDSLEEQEQKDEKYLYHTSSMSNKLHTISKLNDYEKSLNIEELVIPKHQVSFKDEIIGFTVPEIKDSKSLQSIMANRKVDATEKIDYLKQVGETLKKIHHLRLYDINFYIHDLHEGNILVTNKDKKIHFVDLDSASFSTEHALPSKPLVVDKKLKYFSKYRFNKAAIPYPGEDSEIYSYIMMILKTLYDGDINRMKLEEFNRYIGYLYTLDINGDLLRLLNAIYTDAPNINPVDYLDDITEEQFYRASKTVYKNQKAKNLI